MSYDQKIDIRTLTKRIFSPLSRISGCIIDTQALSVNISQYANSFVVYSYRIEPHDCLIEDFCKTFQFSDSDEDPEKLIGRLNQAMEMFSLRKDVELLKKSKLYSHEKN